MADSVGRIALGVVGALILAPVGLGAVGFSIGSAIGGFIFAPEGPKTSVEGPRIGDTEVTSSSLGKMIPQQYGITRSAGNMIWTGGIKETKTVTTTSAGGKGGGPSQTTTTYSYSASFAVVFGLGVSQDVLRIWADGKLIYDSSGVGSTATQGPEFNFRFYPGGSTQGVDTLIAESINRRLAGLPDINEGTGPQSEFTTIAQLISQLEGEEDPRSAIYADYLATLKTAAEAEDGTPPEYGFTPSYKEVCYIVFEDMPLGDFANRIPNITAEIVWSSNQEIPPEEEVDIDILTEISEDTTEPVTALAVDQITRTLLVQSGSRLRKFSESERAEVLETDNTETYYAQPEDPGQSGKSATVTVTELLGVTDAGDYVARFSRSGSEVTSDYIGTITNAGLGLQAGAGGSGWYTFSANEMPAGALETTYVSRAGSVGGRSMHLGCTPSGIITAFDSAYGFAYAGSFYGNESGTFAGGSLGDGPMAFGGTPPEGTSARGYVYWLSFDETDWKLFRITTYFGTGGNNSSKPGEIDAAFQSNVQVSLELLDSGLVADQTPRNLVYDASTGLINTFWNRGSGGAIIQYDADAAGTADDPYLQYDMDLTYPVPAPKSGFQNSQIQNSRIIYLYDENLVVIDTTTGEELVIDGVLDGAASQDVQVYYGATGTAFTWAGGVPVAVRYGITNSGLYSTDLADVIADICRRTGMESDEYDVSEISGLYSLRGYTIGRPSTGRASLETLLMTYFVDAVESDWTVAFRPRTSDSVRTISERDLGSVKAATGEVPLVELRQPEYEMPLKVTVNYTDIERDYQMGSVYSKRIADPVPAMYAKKAENVELPIVMQESEARDVSRKLLFQTWMSRDTSKAALSWKHADLDPADVITFAMDSGRSLINRISKATMGANFEVEVESTRSGDPVYTSQPSSAVGSSGVPSVSVTSPVISKLFVLDIPLIEDFHDTGRVSSRYYTVVGADTSSFLSAELFRSETGTTFESFDTAVVDASWGQVIGDPLPRARELWTLDTESSITVRLSVDNGDVASTTLDAMMNEDANLAIVYDQISGVGEIIQFQNVTDNADGTVTLDTFIRGRRGTDTATETHVTGEYFIMLTSSAIRTQSHNLSSVGSTRYFKAVSRGALIGAAATVTREFEGRDLKPYAPNNVVRTDDGSDLTVTWTRRSRIGGDWNMEGTGIETLPLNEDTEEYRFFVLPNSSSAINNFDPEDVSTYEYVTTVGSPTVTIVASDLTTFGYTLEDTINVAVYQVSAQVGLGFGRVIALPA